MFPALDMLKEVYEIYIPADSCETYDGMVEILKAHSPHGIQIRFSKWALGEHASEAGSKVA